MKWMVVVEYLNGNIINEVFDSYKKSVRYLTVVIASKDIVPIRTTICRYIPV
jgi:hypothetical protein